MRGWPKCGVAVQNPQDPCMLYNLYMVAFTSNVPQMLALIQQHHGSYGTQPLTHPSDMTSSRLGPWRLLAPRSAWMLQLLPSGKRLNNKNHHFQWVNSRFLMFTRWHPISYCQGHIIVVDEYHGYLRLPKKNPPIRSTDVDFCLNPASLAVHNVLIACRQHVFQHFNRHFNVLKKFKNNWLVVWNMNGLWLSLGNVIIPTDFHSMIFQRA